MSIDMLFTQDGDIQPTIGRTLADGSIVYDIALAHNDVALSQIIYNRIKTMAPDWFLHPELGSNLEDIIGEANNKITASRGEGLITKVLTFDGLLSEDLLYVKGIPTSHDTIVFIITVVRENGSNIVIPLTFNLYTGINL
jgi:hypothetical protein